MRQDNSVRQHCYAARRLLWEEHLQGVCSAASGEYRAFTLLIVIGVFIVFSIVGAAEVVLIGAVSDYDRMLAKLSAHRCGQASKVKIQHRQLRDLQR